MNVRRILGTAICGLFLTTSWLFPATANAATWTVRTTADDGGTAACPNDGCPTLRDALNTAASGDTISLAPVRGVITLTDGSELSTGKSLTIFGPGPTLLTIQSATTQSAATSRVFEFTAGTVSLYGVNISHGNGTGGKSDAWDGGGILVDPAATLNLSNCSVDNNLANGNGGSGTGGGGIYNFGTLNLLDTEVSNNTADAGTNSLGFGGGIYSQGNLTVTGSQLIGNSAQLGGGGLDCGSGSATITGTSFSSNVVGNGTGGGVLNSDSSGLTLTNSSLNQNTAVKGGGIYNSGDVTVSGSAIYQNGGSDGSGIYNDNNGTATLINSTLSKNSASSSGNGGGIYNQNTCTAVNVTISGNSLSSGAGGGIYNDPEFTGALNLINTIAVGNTATTDPDVSGTFDQSGTVGNNLIGTVGDATGFSTTHHDITGVTETAVFGSSTLMTNSGPTAAIAPSPAGPAINAGNNAVTGSPYFLTTDQRGCLRVYGGQIDIGSYEFGATAPPTITKIYPVTLELPSSAGPLNFTLADAVEPVGSLTVTAASSDAAVVPIANIALGGSGANQTVTLTPANAGYSAITLTVTDPSTGLTASTIFTIDAFYVSNVAIDNVSVTAGASGSSVVSFLVTSNQPLWSPISVAYATSNGTAIAGTNYTANSGTLTIPVGSTSASIPVTVLGTAASASPVSFTVTLSDPVNSAIAIGTGTCTITYDVPPSAVSITPSPLSSHAYQPELITTTCDSASGNAALASVALCVGGLSSPASSLYLKYLPAANLFYACNSSGTYTGGFAPGSANTIATSLGLLNCAATTVSKNGNQLAVTWSITPYESLVGTQNDYLIASDIHGLSSGWQKLGAWTIAHSLPAVVGLTPGSTTSQVGVQENLTTTFSDTDGNVAFNGAAMVVGPLTGSTNSLAVKYVRSTNLLYLADANNVLQGGFTPGTDNAITTTQGTLNCKTTTVTQSGNQMVITWAISPSGAVTGAQPVNLIVSDGYGQNSGWVQAGTWTVADSTPQALAVMPTPLTSPAGVEQILTTTFANPGGTNYLSSVAVVIGSLTSPTNSIALKYVPGTNLLYLADSNNTLQGGFAPGSSNTITTSQGTLDCTNTTVTTSGDQITVNWAIVPSTADLGTNAVNLIASDPFGQNSGWQDLGTWTIDATAPVSLTPAPLTSPVGQAETLTATYGTDTAAANLGSVALCVGPVASPATSLFAKYVPATNLLYLCNATGTYVGGFAPGTNQTITTNLGVLNCAATTMTRTNNEITVAWNITPAASLVGAQPLALVAGDIYGNNSGWIGFPDWTITSVQTSSLGSGQNLGQPVKPSAHSS